MARTFQAKILESKNSVNQSFLRDPRLRADITSTKSESFLENNQTILDMLTTKIKYNFCSLVVFNIILLFGGCIASDGNRCQDGKEYKDFEVLVTSFSAL